MSIEGNVEEKQTFAKLIGKITTVPKVDDTLTKEGQAADAKKTGEELARLETMIETMGASLGNEG